MEVYCYVLFVSDRGHISKNRMLAEIANGLLALRPGVSDLNGLKLMGVDVSRPMIRMGESVRTIRDLVQGESVSTSGRVWNMTDIRMVPSGQTKI